MEDLHFKSVSALHLQSGTQCLWGTGSLQEQMLGTVSAMEELLFVSSGEFFGDLNT